MFKKLNKCYPYICSNPILLLDADVFFLKKIENEDFPIISKNLPCLENCIDPTEGA